MHVDDVAEATLLALDQAAAGVYNIVDDDPVDFRDLLPALAQLRDAEPPLRTPRWLARLISGSSGVDVMTGQRGASNTKAQTELNWRPEHASWRSGFTVEYAKEGESRAPEVDAHIVH